MRYSVSVCYQIPGTYVCVTHAVLGTCEADTTDHAADLLMGVFPPQPYMLLKLVAFADALEPQDEPLCLYGHGAASTLGVLNKDAEDLYRFAYHRSRIAGGQNQ